MAGEALFIAILCAYVTPGEPEARRAYQQDYNLGYIKVDCETDSHVIEVGLDKRGSLDSLQQAVFASVVTGKKPAIILIDRDGVEGKYEYRIRKAAQAMGVRYQVFSDDWLIRHQMTWYFRHREVVTARQTAALVSR